MRKRIVAQGHRIWASRVCPKAVLTLSSSSASVYKNRTCAMRHRICPRLTSKGHLFRPPNFPRRAAELHLDLFNRRLRPHKGHPSSLQALWTGLGMQLYFRKTESFWVLAA